MIRNQSSSKTDLERILVDMLSKVASASTAVAMPGPGGLYLAAGVEEATSLALGRIVERVRSARAGRLGQVLHEASIAAHLSPQEFASRLTETGTKTELAVRGLSQAQDTALQEKLRAIGNALASGALAEDDATVGDELLFLRVLDALEMPHVRLMRLLGSTRSGDARVGGVLLRDGWHPQEIAERDHGLAETLPVLLASLRAEGLVESTEDRGGMVFYQGTSMWSLTAFGRRCLERMYDSNISQV